MTTSLSEPASCCTWESPDTGAKTVPPVAFTSGHRCPQRLPGLRPWWSLCFTALSAFSLLWSSASPEPLANLHCSTVAKNTLSRGLLSRPRLTPAPRSNQLHTTGIHGALSLLHLRPCGYLWEVKGREFLMSFPCHPNVFSYGSGIPVSIRLSSQKQSNFVFSSFAFFWSSLSELRVLCLCSRCFFLFKKVSFFLKKKSLQCHI